MLIICGIGNPGRKYKNTRHNVGFQFIDSIIKNYNFKAFKKDKLKEVYQGLISNRKCYLLKPLTFVNLTGPAISKFLRYYKISINNLLIVHDDLDLLPGKIKIKKGGGNAGHNGLASIDREIGNLYNRFRIGIGHPGSKKLVSKYVLEKFTPEEEKIIKNIIKISTNNIDLLIKKRELFLSKINNSIRNKK